MAAVSVTAGSVVYHNWGDTGAASFDITSVDDGDTFTASNYGFGVLHNCVFNPTTAVVVTPTISGSVITFKVAAGSVAGRLTVWGR